MYAYTNNKAQYIINCIISKDDINRNFIYVSASFATIIDIWNTFVYKGFMNYKRNRFLYNACIVLIINVLILLLLYQLNFFRYESISEFYTQNLLNGSEGNIYIYGNGNFLFNWVISFLYEKINTVNWYGVILLGSLIIAASIIGICILEKFSLSISIPILFLSLPFTLILGARYFSSATISYIILAASVCVLMLKYNCYKAPPHMKMDIIACVLFVFSALLNQRNGWYIILIYLTVYLFTATHKIVRISILQFTTIVLVVLMIFMQGKEYQQYDVFDMLNEGREKITNYVNEEDIIELTDSSDVEALLIKNNIYFDDVNSIEILSKRTELLSSKAKMPPLHNDLLFTSLCLVLGITMSIWTNKKKKNKLLIIIVFIESVLFSVNNLTLINLSRIFIIPVIASLMIMNKPFVKASIHLNNLVSYVIIAIAIVGIANQLVMYKWDNDARNARLGSNIEQNRVAFENMYLNQDYIFTYLSNNPLHYAYDSYSIFYAFPKEYFLNSHDLSGIDFLSEPYNDFKSFYGLGSFPQELIDNSKILLVVPQDRRAYKDYLKYYFNEDGINIEYEDKIPLGGNLVASKVAIHF